MKSKKIIIAFLFLAILASQLMVATLITNSYAMESKSEEKFYYNQFDFNKRILNTSIYNKYIGSVINSKENSNPTFTTTIAKSGEKPVYFGEEFEVNVRVSDLVEVEKGIIVVYGKLNYDENVLSLVEMAPQKEWQITYNEKNKVFVMDNDAFINNENIGENDCILKLKFRVNDTISQETNTSIEIVNIMGSNSKIDISSENARLDISIIETPVEPIFNSEKYNIEENYITRIAPNTTFATFKSNIETNQELVLRDREGNLLDLDSYELSTNMTLTVGNNKVYTLVVIADIADIYGNGEITVTDLAKLKLHYIGLEPLTGAALKAADINGDGVITITDIAQIKLYLTGLMEIK